jgi:hypothetical protein
VTAEQEVPMEPIGNFKFMVGAQGDSVVFLRGVPPKLSVPDALELAAMICALFDHDDKVPAMVTQIRSQD